jgi:ATP-binding cassette, subfamily A (ABC1), member 3
LFVPPFLVSALIPPPLPTPIKTETGPMLIALGLLYPVAAMIGSVVREKELRQKELMKMMSVSESDIGWSWFLSFALFHLVSATLASIASTFLFTNASFRILWIFWVFSFLAVIAFVMAISTVSSKTPRSVLIGLLVFFAGVFLTIAVDSGKGTKSIVWLINLHPVATFSYGIQTIGMLEDLDLGLTSSTYAYSENTTGYRFADTMNLLGIDIVLWGFLSWYLNRVIPPAYGQALPVWFLFDPSYWRGGTVAVRNESTPSRNDADYAQNQDEEEMEESRRRLRECIPLEPVGEALRRQADLGQSIEIRNLRKKYNEKIAVDDLTLSIYSGHITALLGHNGAFVPPVFFG